MEHRRKHGQAATKAPSPPPHPPPPLRYTKLSRTAPSYSRGERGEERRGGPLWSPVPYLQWIGDKPYLQWIGGKPYPYILLIPGMLLMLVVLLLFSSLPAHADGGAPNLAYVVGTPKG